MKWPGISLKTMMFAIAILAADFGFFSNLDFFDHFSPHMYFNWVVFVIGLLPMANVIALGLPRLLWLGLPRLFRRVRRMPFSIGFQVTSWVSTLAVLTVVFLKREAVIEMHNDWMKMLFPTIREPDQIVPPAEPPSVDRFESLCEAVLGPDGRPEIWISSIGSMAFFSLPPLLVSLAGGLITRVVVRRRIRKKSA